MKLFNYILALLLTLLSISCTFKSEGVILDERSEEYMLYDYYVDEYGNEGIVVYIAQNEKYAIVLSADESYEQWGPTDEQVYSVDASSLQYGTQEFGLAMHQLMKAKGIERYPAQYWCDRKNGENELSYAGSWRLPSYKELRIIFGDNGLYVGKIQSALKHIGGTLLDAEKTYWTCAEDYDGYLSFKDVETDYDPENRAVLITYLNSAYATKDRWIKKNKHYVRAIKYVYYSISK